MSKLCSLTTQTPPPRAAAPPGKRSTVKLCTQVPKAPCDLRATSSMWASPDLPFDPKIAFTTPHPLLVAECRCWRPLRFSHVVTVRQANTSERGVGRASSTEMGQPFQPLADFGPPPPLLQQQPADTESSIPQRRLGDAPLHHQPHRYSRGTPLHRDVGTAPPPFSGWYGAHRHPLRMWAVPLPQSSYGALPPRGRQCTYGPTAHPSFNTQQANIVLQPHHTSYWGGGGGGARRHLCNASLQCLSSSVF